MDKKKSCRGKAEGAVMKIGVIGDTHGVLHPSVLPALSGMEKIIHTGDIGGPAVLSALQEIAPVTAVRGNYDNEPDIKDRLLPDPSGFELAGLRAMITHRMITMEWEQNKQIIAERVLMQEPAPELFFFGHTHVPILEKVKGIWFINPGYCGPDPYEAPPTLIRLELSHEEFTGEIIYL
ncbi:MAG: metallophosphoesterase family protein [bacterium]